LPALVPAPAALAVDRAAVRDGAGVAALADGHGQRLAVRQIIDDVLLAVGTSQVLHRVFVRHILAVDRLGKEGTRVRHLSSRSQASVY